MDDTQSAEQIALAARRTTSRVTLQSGARFMPLDDEIATPGLNAALISQALKLAAGWADSAGLALTWMQRSDAMSQALIDPDAGHRAHWRCAVELVRLCAKESGREVADLLRDLTLEPVGQDTEGPGS